MLITKTRALIALPMAASTALVASPAFAAGGTSVTDVAAGVDFTDVKSAMVSIAVLAIGLVVLWKGIQYVKRATNGS